MELISRDYLIHYGIKGQQWGRQNGPPYPLSQANKSSSEKKAEAEEARPKNQNGNAEEKKRFSLSNLTPEQKRAIKIGAIVVGSSLLIGGTIYAVNKSGMIGQSSTFDSAQLMHSTKPLADALKNYPSNKVTVSKSQKLQRVSSKAAEDYAKRGETYCSYLMGDNQTYKNQFINSKYVHELSLNKDVNAPSVKETAEIFQKLNPKATEGNFHMFINKAFMSNSDSYINSNDPVDKFIQQSKKTFVNEVKRRGYNAIVDIYDYERVAKSPLILFNPSEVISSDKSRPLGSFEKVVARTIEKPWRASFN